MKVIAQRFWHEPAVAVGLLVSLALVFVNVIGEDDWGVENILAVLGPLITALGIRPLVTPTNQSKGPS
jgi:hypothetical protein